MNSIADAVTIHGSPNKTTEREEAKRFIAGYAKNVEVVKLFERLSDCGRTNKTTENAENHREFYKKNSSAKPLL